MSVALEIVQTWDEPFFADFVSVRNQMYQKKFGAVNESIEDIAVLLKEGMSFEKAYSWQAAILREDGRAIARALICWKDGEDVFNLGFFECPNDKELFSLFYIQIESMARSEGAKDIKWPVNGNFYHSYRIQKSGDPHELGPCAVYHEYYHELFASKGYKIIRQWENMRRPFEDLAQEQESANAYLSKKYEAYRNLKIRHVDMSRYEDEMRTVFELMNRSFSYMDDYEAIEFKEFYESYKAYRPILDPGLISIGEYHGEAISFCLSFKDYKPSLYLRDRIRRLPIPKLVRNKISDLVFYAHYKLSNQKILVCYLGKIEDDPSKAVKGLWVAHSYDLVKYLQSKNYKQDIYYVLVEESSPIRPQIEKTSTVYSTMQLYGKSIVAKKQESNDGN